MNIDSWIQSMIISTSSKQLLAFLTAALVEILKKVKGVIRKK